MSRLITSRCMLLALIIIVMFGAASMALAMSESMKKPGKMPAQGQMEAYQLFKQKCLGCHVSVADPERSGKTRDAWTVVVKYMDKHYVELSDAEADKIVDLLFALRRGLERDPG